MILHSRIFSVLLLLLVAASCPHLACAETVETIVNNGSPTNRVDIAIMGDGYTAAQMDKYKTDAQQFIQLMFAQDPYREYRSYFNVHRVDVISNQSGADHPERNSFVDTALDAGYNCGGTQRLICVDFTKSQAALNRSVSPAQSDIKLVIVNDPEYGGSGGFFAVASVNVAAVEIILHEVGHSFGLLGDEYAGNTCGQPDSAPNITKTTNRSLIKWNYWIDAATPIPTFTTTPAVPGLYEGALYCDNGYYRPTWDSKMRTLNRPFEQINLEQLIKRIYNIVSPFDSTTPSNLTLTLDRGQVQNFSVSNLIPFSHALDVTWFVDGTPVGTSDMFALDTAALDVGGHTVDVLVKDNTSAVRSDVDQLLSETRRWNLTIAQGPTIHFSSSNYNVVEGGTSLNVTIVRSGDTTGPASVDYRTTDTDTFTFSCSETVNNLSGAYARCDFATTLDTLFFAPGEISKSITVPIINDSWAEGNETFSIVLSNPVGVSLSAPSTTVVTINDNEGANGPNPIFTTPFFVRQHYLDFLSREPETGEPWSSVLNNCSDVNNNPACDRLTVSAAFFGSPEFQLKGYFVYRFYKLAFNRLPIYTEIVSDMRAVTGQTPNEVFQKKATFTNSFVQRTEFTNNFGTLTNSQYVTSLMGRYGLSQITTPDPAAPDGTVKVTLTTADLVSRLNAATLNRAQVLRAIADSDQVFSLEFNQAFVAMQYYGYLRRTPDTNGYNSWLNFLNANPNDSRTMVNGFMNSTEYRLRFGP